MWDTHKHRNSGFLWLQWPLDGPRPEREKEAAKTPPWHWLTHFDATLSLMWPAGEPEDTHTHTRKHARTTASTCTYARACDHTHTPNWNCLPRGPRGLRGRKKKPKNKKQQKLLNAASGSFFLISLHFWFLPLCLKTKYLGLCYLIQLNYPEVVSAGCHSTFEISVACFKQNNKYWGQTELCASLSSTVTTWDVQFRMSITMIIIIYSRWT